MDAAADADPVDDMTTGEHYSWQDVYTSYGCDLDLEAADDDG